MVNVNDTESRSIATKCSLCGKEKLFGQCLPAILKDIKLQK